MRTPTVCRARMEATASNDALAEVRVGLDGRPVRLHPLADGAVHLPRFGNALQGVGAEIVELNSRARN
jgi:hypothetical protein